MSLNAAEIRTLVAEHREEIEGARIQRIRAAGDEPDTLLLTLHRAGTTREWLVCTRSPWVRLHPTGRRIAGEREASAFVMLLRKHLMNARILAAELPENDRWIRLRIRRAEDDVSLVLLLFGRSADVLLLDHADAVLGSSRGASGQWVPPSPADRPSPPVREALAAPGPPPLHERIDTLYAARMRETGTERVLARAMGLVGRNLRRLERRGRAVEEDIARIDRAPELRRQGDLLQMARGKAEDGADHVVVPDVFAPGAPPVRVPLDPSIGLETNIERAYRTAKRLERGAEHALARLEALEAERAVLEQAERAIADLEQRNPDGESGEALTPAEVLEGVEAILAAAGLGGESRGLEGKRRERPAERLPYVEYESGDGLAILVGRGGADNDALTVRVARGNDLWLHAEDWAGAHVVVRRAGRGEIPRRTQEEAALLAAHFSKGRTDTVVGVRVTERKNVRKARGSAPGRVEVSRSRTVEVSPSGDARLREVLSRRRDPRR